MLSAASCHPAVVRASAGRGPGPECGRLRALRRTMMTWAIDLLQDDRDLDGVLEVEGESFSNPWTRDMYVWELQNRSVCHIFIVRTTECPVAGFCACWLVFDEVHINNV